MVDNHQQIGRRSIFREGALSECFSSCFHVFVFVLVFSFAVVDNYQQIGSSTFREGALSLSGLILSIISLSVLLHCPSKDGFARQDGRLGKIARLREAIN